MNGDSSSIQVDLTQLAEDLEEVVHSNRPTKAFWNALLSHYGRLSEVHQAIILVRRHSETLWRPAAEYSQGDSRKDAVAIPKPKFREWSAKAAERVTTGSREPLSVGSQGYCLAGVKLRLLSERDACVAIFLFESKDLQTLNTRLGRIHLVAGAPRTFQLYQAVESSKQDVEKFSRVFDLLVPLNEEDRFLAAALSFCNSLSNNLNCERVSLGWYEGGYVKLKAVSRTEKFDRQMAAAQEMEAAMDECLDQDEAILWPAPDEQVAISRNHRKFSESQKVAHIVSLPLRHKEEGVAVLLCERDQTSFPLSELQQLRLAADLATPRLVSLKAQDRWIGARAKDRARDLFSSWLGPEHTWAKVLALTITLLLAALIFLKADYRVEGDFIVRSKEVVYLTTPFNGFINQVYYEAGDLVEKGDLLLSLNSEELRLQEAAELADVASYARQSERARAANLLADMRIADARKAQAEARLSIVKYRLAQAEIRAPFDAVIIEGDLRELRGKPIEQGNPLFKVAQLDGMFMEVDIDERDVHEVLDSNTGEIAFVSRPRIKFPVRVSGMESSAFTKNERNVFRMRCDPQDSDTPWWRPGMTGVCKVDVEKRSLLWIIGHRTIDFFRLWLWW